MIRPLLVSLSLILPLSADEPGWVTLFNGKDLSGWTPKIAKHPLGENTFDTFRVEDGILKCEYHKYPSFDKRFGHLYTDLAYSYYILRMEYKFAGKMMADAPGYVNLNSGVMAHSQPPQSMTLEQGFPASIEFQFLADEGKGPRPTGNVCTPRNQYRDRWQARDPAHRPIHRPKPPRRSMGEHRNGSPWR